MQEMIGSGVNCSLASTALYASHITVWSVAMFDLNERDSDVNRGYAMEDSALKVLRDLTSEEWKEALRIACRRRDSSTWAIGDLLVYAGQRGDWGHYYDEAMAITHLGYASLCRKSTVSTWWTPDKRVPEAPWSWHSLVMAMQQSARIATVKRALDKNWNFTDLEAYVQAMPPEDVDQVQRRAARRTSPKPKNRLMLQCPSCSHTWEPKKKDWKTDL